VREDPTDIIVIGGSGGIGRAFVDELLTRFPASTVHATFHRTDLSGSEPSDNNHRLHWHPLDLRDSAQVESFANGFDRIDWVVNCAGFLHGKTVGPEKNIRSVESEFLIDSFKINTVPTLLLAKHFSTALKTSPAPLLATVSARVGSIEDNRLGGWYSYRISKAALNMALKTLSIEWKHSHPKGCVAALHPGTNDTPLSKPFQANVAPENLFDPAYTASSFVTLLASFTPEHSGKFWAWNGENLPW